MSNEHVEVLRAMLDDAAIEPPWKPEEVAAITAAIASLSAPQPPAEAHCATCSCVPGMTPAVRFDTTPAEKEGAVRDHLIRMGWTPPAEAQPVACSKCGVRQPFQHSTDCGRTPPSAPVGVESSIMSLRDAANEIIRDGRVSRRAGYTEYLVTVLTDAADRLEALAHQPVAPTWIGIDWAEGQQPAAVDEAMVERACKAAVAQCSPNEVWPDDYSEADDLRAMMQAALAAALAGQQGDKK